MFVEIINTFYFGLIEWLDERTRLRETTSRLSITGSAS